MSMRTQKTRIIHKDKSEQYPIVHDMLKSQNLGWLGLSRKVEVI